SLVTEAGYQGTVAFSASRTFPVSASMTSRASAWSVQGATIASAAARRIAFDSDLLSNRRVNCTSRFRSFETRLVRARRSCPTFGFQACPARHGSPTARANLYRRRDSEQRFRALIRRRSGLNFGEIHALTVALPGVVAGAADLKFLHPKRQALS